MNNFPSYDYLLLKVAMRCNIACTYCYWFRDEKVYDKPKVLTEAVELAVLQKLKSYISRKQLTQFEIIFHGGEPLLFGKKRFDNLCNQLRILEAETNCHLLLSVTTNGLLIDSEWIALFKKYRMNIGISLDGYKQINDTSRVDFKGNGTFDKVKKAIKLLQEANINPGILAVCQPEETDISAIYQCFVEELKLTQFDFLIPDATYHTKPKSILGFYKKIFDGWYNVYSHQGVFITMLESMIRGVLGYRSLSNAIGHTPVKTITVLTDGTIEPLDYLRIAEAELTVSPYNVLTDELDVLQTHPVWQEVYSASLNLHEKCNSCKFKYACGGGPLQSRWNNENRFNNPSVYCDDLYQLFDYVSNQISNDLYSVPQ